MKNLFQFLKLVTVFGLIIIIMGEVTIRVLPGLITTKPPYDMAEIDNELGWKNKSNYQFEGSLEDINGKKYKVNIQTNANGFRRIPSPIDPTRPNVFIIGDSYTQAVEVSNSYTYFNLMGEEYDLDIYAYGSAGYGTLQEWMILDRYIDDINPMYVILQFCSNDFIDNYAPLELESTYKVGVKRPYLTLEGDIIYSRPVIWYKPIMEYSSFYKFVVLYGKKVLHKLGVKNRASAEAKIATQQKEYELYNKSLQITEMILQKIKDRIHIKSHLIVFSSDMYEPQFSDIMAICEKLDIDFCILPNDALLDANLNGIEIHSSDGYHWNEKGHQIVSEWLIKSILQIEAH